MLLRRRRDTWAFRCNAVSCECSCRKNSDAFNASVRFVIAKQLTLAEADLDSPKFTLFTPWHAVLLQSAQTRFNY